MHGNGFRQTLKGSEYVGVFHDGDRHGRGVNKEKNGDRYIGFFQNDSKEGHGTFCYGNVSESWDHGLQRAILKNDNMYEGNWRGGNYRRLGIHTQMQTGRVWFTTTKKSDDLYIAMKGLQKKDDTARNRKKFSAFRCAQRGADFAKQMQKKNLKLFATQRRLARKFLEEEAIRLAAEKEDLELELEDLVNLLAKRSKMNRRASSQAQQMAASDKDDLIKEEVDRLSRLLDNLPKLTTAAIFHKAELESAAASKQLQLRSKLKAQAGQPSEKMVEMMNAGGY